MDGVSFRTAVVPAPRGLQISFQRAAELCLYACGLAGPGVLPKLTISSCCMGKTSWGVA